MPEMREQPTQMEMMPEQAEYAQPQGMMQ